MKSFLKKYLFWIVVSIVILGVPLIIYLIQFGSKTLSHDFKEWVDFSQYYTLFITLFNGIIILILMWKIHRDTMSHNKPLVVFTISNGIQHPHTIKNIGNGPAINIDIYTAKEKGKWDYRIKGLTLGKGEEIRLKIDGQLRLGAVYSDQAGTKDRSFMQDTFMRFKDIDSEFNQTVGKEIFIWQL